MKKMIFLILCVGYSITAFSQLQDIKQLQLDLEKLVQMKAMLSNMYNGYATLTSGYKQVTGLAKGNFDLHKTWLDQLLQVAPQVRKYPIIQIILDKQSSVLAEAATAYTAYIRSGLLVPKELSAIKNRFDQFKSLIARKLDQLTIVLTPGILRMSDQERINTIDRIDKDVGEAVTLVMAEVKEQNAVVAERVQQKKDIGAMRAWYGLKQ